MPQVQCTIYGDLPDSGSACYLHIEAPVTINKVDDSFPFEGKFHYRAKVPGRELGLRDVDYVWMDIIDRNMPLMFSNDLIELRVLPLEIPTEPVEDSAAIEHIEKILEHVPKDRPIAQREEPYRDYIQQPNQQQRSANKPAQSFGNFAKSLNKALPSQISNVKDSANSIWKAMKSKAVNFLSNEADIPKENAYVLAELAGKATTSFSDYEESHAMILERLWNNLFPGQEYQRDNVGWKQAGFQKSDPVADLKNSGILALCSMVTFIEMYTDRARSMIEKNKINTKTNYPFAIVGINLTLLLIELFCLRNSNYATVNADCWNMFTDEVAFYEVFSLAFIHIDQLWLHRKAVRADFGNIIGEVKTLLGSILLRGPKSIQQFRFIAADEGMAILD